MRKRSDLLACHCLLVGVSIFVTGSVFAATANNDDDPTVAASLKEQTRICAEGQTPGTVGHAINEAVRIHTGIAATQVDTDSMFTADNDCFSRIRDLIDLSSTIPSFGSIWSSIQGALEKWAERKVCSTVLDMANRVLEPVNRTVQDVNDIADLNGMTNGMIREGMRGIDPGLGNIYRDAEPGRTETYRLNRNPFGIGQEQNGGQQDNGRATKGARRGKALPPGHGDHQTGREEVSPRASELLENMTSSLNRQRDSSVRSIDQAAQKERAASGRQGRQMYQDESQGSQDQDAVPALQQDQPRRDEADGVDQTGSTESDVESGFEQLQKLFSR